MDIQPTSSGVWTVLGKSAVAIPNTGSTTDNTLATVVVPGGSMGPNGIVRIWSIWSAAANNANAKNGFVKFNANTISALSLANALSIQDCRQMHNRGVVNSQVAFAGGTAFVSVTNGLFTLTGNTAIDRNVTFTAQLANAADTITLEAYLVELLYGA